MNTQPFSLSDTAMLHLFHQQLTLKGPLQFGCLFPLSLLQLGQSPQLPLFPRLPRHPRRTRTRPNCKPLVRQPRFQNTPDHIQCARLRHPAPDRLTPPNPDIHNTLKRQRKSIRGVFVERRRVQCGGQFRLARRRWGKSVEHGWVFWRWGAHAEVVQDAHKSLKTAVHGHDLADARRGRR